MTTDAAPARAPHPWHVAIVCGMASYIDAAAIVSSGIALVIYQQAIGLTNGQVGILSGLLTFCIAIGAITGGRLGDRLGRRHVFIATMAMVVLGAVLLVLAGTFTSLLLGTVLVGLGTGADLPVSLATISEAASDANRGKLLGFSQVLWTAGILGTTATSAVVGGMGHLGGQIMFAMIGVIALVVLALRLTIPESRSWQDAHAERLAGADTVRAQRTGLKDLLTERLYLVPFAAILVFYSLTNIGANTGGQFGTWIAVNVVGVSVQLNSLISLVLFPAGFLWAFLFMRIVDTPHRMTWFLVGAVALVVSYLLPAVLGFSLPVWIIMQIVNGFGGGFAFEAIMKVWSQESFPTLMRSSAQGTTIAVARVIAAVAGILTPSLLYANPRAFYAGIAAVVLIGVVVGHLVFRSRRANLFDVEAKDLGEAQEELMEQGLRADAPAGPSAGTRPGPP
ncbi:MFS transporter [Brachybacterium halotolerans]|nr:MFS transporter [Brachybacterium halotolerans]